jgi:hypothetical protein
MLLLYRDNATDINPNFSSNQADTLAFRFLHANEQITAKVAKHSLEMVVAGLQSF